MAGIPGARIPGGVPSFLWAPPLGPAGQVENSVAIDTPAPGPVYVRVALCMAFAVMPPQAPAVAPPAAPNIAWQQPTAVPAKVPVRIDTNAALAWAPQATYPAPTPATLEWLQPFASRTAPRPVYDLNNTWAPQPPTVVVVTPPIGWLQPFTVPSLLLRRIDTNAALSWVPQPSFNAAPTATLEWLAPFAFRTAPRPFYDLNITWVPQPSFNAAPTNTLEWLQPFPVRFAPRPVFELNSGYVPQPPPTVAVTPSTLGWLQQLAVPSRETLAVTTVIAPFSVPALGTPTPSTLEWLQPLASRNAARPVFDLNNGWVPPSPPPIAVTPGPLGWLQPFPTTRETIVASAITYPVTQPAVAGTPSTLGWLQPFGFRTPPRPFYDLNSGWAPKPPPPFATTPSTLGWLQPFGVPPQPPRRPTFNEVYVPQNVGGQAPPIRDNDCLLLLEDGTGNVILEDNSGFLALEFCENMGWLQPFAFRTAAKPVYDLNSGWVPTVPPVVVTPPPFGWFSQYTTPPRETVVANTVLAPFAVPVAGTPTPSELGWLQPFGIPRQPVRLWDWNTAWPAAPPPAFAITPSILGWLVPFGIPPQPPRRPIFIEFYVPQNVGGTAPIPPTVLQPGGASVPHTFSRKRWRELQALIAAENAAVAKAERLTKDSKREPLLKAARAAAAAIDAADKEGENKRLDALLLRNAESLRNAIRASTDVKRIREAAAAIELSNIIVARAVEDEEDEMIQLLLLLS